MHKVSIIVTAYLEKSKPYLDACIASIKNLDYPSECIEVLIVTPTWYIPQYEGCQTIHPCYGAYDNPIAVNHGFAQASPDSRYFVLLNDDVIMTRDSLKNLVMSAGDSDVILGAISNCDQWGQFQLHFPLQLEKRQYRLEEIADKIPEMMNAKSFYPQGFIFPQTLYLFANLIPRKVWEKVTGGTTPDAIGFDTNYHTSWDDTDYCQRAQQRGVRLALCLDSLVWHCSGVSADITQGDLKSDKRAQSEAHFRKKWGYA